MDNVLSPEKLTHTWLEDTLALLFGTGTNALARAKVVPSEVLEVDWDGAGDGGPDEL